MTRTPAENDHLPIYEDLVRERGDVVAEAQLAAAHTQHRAAELLPDENADHWNQRQGQHHSPGFG